MPEKRKTHGRYDRQHYIKKMKRRHAAQRAAMVFQASANIENVVIDNGKFKGRKIGDLTLREAQCLYAGWNGIQDKSHHHAAMVEDLRVHIMVLKEQENLN